MRLKVYLRRGLGIVAGIFAAAAAGQAADIGTAFTYQGQLAESGDPADGVYDFQFRLFTGEFPFGFVVGNPVVVENVNVVDGKFSAKIDFGSAFPGQARWLDISVRPGASSGSFTTLAPRQELTPAPYAIGLALPYSASDAKSSALFSLGNTGTGGAMSLSSTSGDTLTINSASGFGINSVSTGTVAAIRGANSGGGNAIYAQTTAGGVPIYGYNLGPTGNAAYFRSESTSNTSATVSAHNNGTGPGVQASARLGSAGVFEITNAPSLGRALDATTAGLGDASRITITNETNWANALVARTYGLGRAGWFAIENQNSTATALEARTVGTGLAGKFVGDVEMHGNVDVDGELQASMGGLLNRASPIAYGRWGHGTGFSGSDNVEREFLYGDNDSWTYQITVHGEDAPAYWIIIADVTYSDPENPTQPHTVRCSPADAQGRFKMHWKCDANCDVFSQQTYGVSFVVYKP